MVTVILLVWCIGTALRVCRIEGEWRSANAAGASHWCTYRVVVCEMQMWACSTPNS